ncbi:SMI1/KNR4 family protein [Pseudomonas putida]|uniref:SMI1/KNR4 family protein n=1 Tax=Pseudomonas putida TaxID=303 RepID=A0A1X0ZTJ2_PSEPU|nr:SMI1/KNR4 family protein [Pseudomonas putida]ORL62998.1 SMI1/KNR4 family protein [Pseudomonas putida]
MLIYTERHDAAPDKLIEEVAERLGIVTGSWILEFWRKSDGALLNDQVLIYSTSDIEERNDTFEVDKNFKGMVAIGDDSGGRIILIDKNDAGKLWLVDAGSVSLEASDQFVSLDQLLDFIASEDDVDDVGIGDIVTVGSKPSLDEVFNIKKALAVNISVVELKKLLEEPEQVLLRSIYAQKYERALIEFSHIIRFR